MNNDIETTIRSSGPSSRLGIFALAVVVTTAGWMSTVSAEGGNVRYSYEEAEVADSQEYILVPRAEGSITGEVTSRTMERAFETLRSAKESVYGNSYAAVSGDDPQEATVEVHIDSNHAQYAPIIKAEAVYTLTEFGISEVEFPDFTEEGLTRADISVPAYTLTVPLWKILPPGRVTSAQVLMPDGALVSIDEVQRRWEDDRESLLDDVYAFLETEEPYTARQVVQVLPELGDVRIGEVTPLLVHDDRHVRRRALGVLEGHEDDRAALEAVSEAIDEEPRASLARQMSEFLGASSIDEFSVEEQFYLLAEGDAEQAQEATGRLAEWDSDERVVDVLYDTLSDERQTVAMVAVESLDALAADERRSEALEDEDIDAEVRLQLAHDLADETNADDVRLTGLSYLAEHLEGGHANQAIRTIAQLDIDSARERVEQFLDDETRQRRRTAIDALVERSDVQSVDALVDSAQDQPEESEMLQAAYDIMVGQSLDVIVEQTQEGSTNVQQVAYQAIGERAARDGGTDEVIDTIENGTAHSDASIRGSSAESLGQIGSDGALETLGEMVDDPEAEVRRSVAVALGQFPDDETSAQVLVDYLDDADSQVVAAAISAMERREDDRAAGHIRELVEADDGVVRAAALEAVITFMPNQEDDTVAEHIGLLSASLTDDDQQVQISALEQLGRFEASMAVTNIAQLVSTRDTDVRSSAIEALAETGHDDAQPLIESALSDSDAEVRRRAVKALTELVGSEARPELEARMEEEDDPEVKELIENHLQQI